MLFTLFVVNFSYCNMSVAILSYPSLSQPSQVLMRIMSRRDCGGLRGELREAAESRGGARGGMIQCRNPDFIGFSKQPWFSRGS